MAGPLDVLLELGALLQVDLDRALAQEGLTSARTHLLWVVHHQGPQTQQALASELGVTPRNVTGLVDALVETGFAERRAHPTDRRASLITLLPRAESIMTVMERQHAELQAQLFEGLPASFSRHLATVRDRLRALIEAST